MGVGVKTRNTRIISSFTNDLKNKIAYTTLNKNNISMSHGFADNVTFLKIENINSFIKSIKR